MRDHLTQILMVSVSSVFCVTLVMLDHHMVIIRVPNMKACALNVSLHLNLSQRQL